MEYNAENQCFLLDDGKSVAAMFELSDVASEARSEEFLLQLQAVLQGLFQDVFPQYFDNESPWIVQFFVQDELSLKTFADRCKEYVRPNVKETSFSQHYFDLIGDHLNLRAIVW